MSLTLMSAKSETAEPKTPLTGMISIVSFATFKTSIAAFSADISSDISLEHRPLAFNILINPMIDYGGGVEKSWR